MYIRYLISIMFVVSFSLSTHAAEQSSKPAPPASAIPAPAVLSIIPAQAEPGAKVIMSGSNFGESSKVFLGSQEIPAVTSDGKLVEFTIPIKLQSGVYALYLQRRDSLTSRPYNFTVLPLRPVLNSLTPEAIPSCNQGKEREITATGLNFNDTSQLFFDGVVIPSKLNSSEALSFTTPQVAGGLHQVIIKNSPDNASVAVGLMIETKPEISHVTIGNEFVNYYELNIEGKNFQQNSTLLVDGMKIGSRGEDLAAREKIIYISCSKMIYQRHPYSPTTKEFRLQVVNSGGEGSQVITVSAP